MLGRIPGMPAMRVFHMLWVRRAGRKSRNLVGPILTGKADCVIVGLGGLVSERLIARLRSYRQQFPDLSSHGLDRGVMIMRLSITDARNVTLAIWIARLPIVNMRVWRNPVSRIRLSPSCFSCSWNRPVIEAVAGEPAAE